MPINNPNSEESRMTEDLDPKALAGRLESIAYCYGSTLDISAHQALAEAIAALASLPAQADGTGEVASGWSKCATEGCGRAASVYFQRGGVGSHYCCACYMKVQALASPPAPLQEEGVHEAWLGEGDGFKSFTRQKTIAERWSKNGIKVTAVYAALAARPTGGSDV